MAKKSDEPAYAPAETQKQVFPYDKACKNPGRVAAGKKFVERNCAAC